jgi:hypothetical protein
MSHEKGRKTEIPNWPENINELIIRMENMSC